MYIVLVVEGHQTYYLLNGICGTSKKKTNCNILQGNVGAGIPFGLQPLGIPMLHAHPEISQLYPTTMGSCCIIPYESLAKVCDT